MKRKITQHGNSQCLCIPKAILELLKWNPKEQWIEITTDGSRLILKGTNEAPKDRLEE